jgi:hypothetical protein
MRGRSNVAKTPEMQGFFVTRKLLKTIGNSNYACLPITCRRRCRGRVNTHNGYRELGKLRNQRGTRVEYDLEVAG